MLTKEAFNALLKTLEEPPDHAFFCLATTEIHKIPETILSRCQVFLFQRFTLEQLVDRLKFICAEEGFTAEDEALGLIARKAEGGMRDAVSLLEQIAAETDNNITAAATQESLGISSSETLENLYAAINEQDAAAGMAIIKTVAQNGQDFRTFGHDFLGFLREKMFVSLNDASLGQILRTIEEFEKALSRLKTSPIIELPFEIAIINLTTGNLTKQSPEPKIQKVTPTASNPAPPAPTPKPDPKPEPAPIEVSEPEPTPQPIVEKAIENGPIKPSNPPTSGPSNLTPEAITAQMSTIIEKSGIPIFAKKSFLTTIPEVSGNRIIFNTDSEFHREKLNDSGTHAKLLGACKELFGNPELTIDFVKKTGISREKANSSATVDDFLTF